MATNVHLTAELERFARECVEEGRYRDVSDVVQAALRLLQEREERRQQFAEMVREVEEETEREGAYTLEEVLKDFDDETNVSQR